jgi:hypothetical protein
VASLTDTEIETLVPIVELQAKRVLPGTRAPRPKIWRKMCGCGSRRSHRLRLGLYCDRTHIGRLAKSVYNAAVAKCEKDRKRRCVSWA